MFNYRKKIVTVNTITILFFIILPYLIFDGKLFIGGDDTRLVYIFPELFLKNISFFSWYNFSSIGSYNPNQFAIPFLNIWYLIKIIVYSRVVLDYFSFSLPLILGFIYFYKLLQIILPQKEDNWSIAYAVSLFYIFSPIILLWHLSVFLYAVWLIALAPILLYHFIKYVFEGGFSNVLYAMSWSLIFSLALFSIPWVLGITLPLFSGVFFGIFLYSKREIILFTKKILIFIIFITLSQMFWLMPFSSMFLGSGSNSYGGQVLSTATADTFSSTVISVASGNVIYPLLNLFQRRIIFDYRSSLMGIVQNFYDKTFYLGILYIVLLVLGLLYFRRYLKKPQQRFYFMLLISFLISLFLFTVNIGPLKYIFLLFGHLPGFVMFRNFSDKFALGYVITYSLVIAFSLYIIIQKYPKKRNLILNVFVLVTIVNFLPVKQVIDRPLWKTKNVGTIISIPKEYLDFMDQIKKTVPPTTNIFSMPYDIASYTFIKDPSSNNVFAGTSPIKIFTGINDFSGELSFPDEAGNMNRAIENNDINKINSIFSKYNMNYIFVTKNIPDQVKKSYLFKNDILAPQNSLFLNELTNKKILTSTKENYELYKTKQNTSLFSGPKITYKKINQVTYRLYIHDLKSPQELRFLESFHKGWKLYLDKGPKSLNCNKDYSFTQGAISCTENNELLSIADLLPFINKPIFGNTHLAYHNYANEWEISPEPIKSAGSVYYIKNKDGGIDFEMTLYFKPQSYFYIGVLISLLAFISAFIYQLWQAKILRK